MGGGVVFGMHGRVRFVKVCVGVGVGFGMHGGVGVGVGLEETFCFASFTCSDSFPTSLPFPCMCLLTSMYVVYV